MKAPALLVAVTLAVMGGVTGCATLGRQAFAKPIVSLVNVRVSGIGLAGGSLDVVLKVSNPNQYRLDATNFHYEVEVDSIELAHGALDHRFTVLQKDSTILHIPLTFTYSGLGAAGRSIWNTGTVTYHVRGDITVATPLGDHTIPFAQEGHYNTVGGL